jgi:hypothetical protein
MRLGDLKRAVSESEFGGQFRIEFDWNKAGKLASAKADIGKLAS